VIPDRGDVVWVTVEPQGEAPTPTRRAALVVSPALYNSRARLALMCPIAPIAKGYPFEVPLPDGLPVHGVVLADHLRSADWEARQAELACRVPPSVIADVLARLKPL
jgi:mRNA interferase MazF